MLIFQDIIQNLLRYWSEQKCVILQSYDLPMGAATFHPFTVFRTLGSLPCNAVYVQPCRRPQDGRHGKHPNRMQHYYQLQVVIKPSVDNIKQLYLASLQKIGLQLADNYVHFKEDNWVSPTLDAAGLGSEIRFNDMEISQFTYFQKMCGIDCEPVSVEIAYGLERLSMCVQGCDNVYDIKYSDELTYGDIFMQQEVQFSRYNFLSSSVKLLRAEFDNVISVCRDLLDKNLVLPAYDEYLKAVNLFNLLDSRGAISHNARPTWIHNIRELARGCGSNWVRMLTGNFNS